MSGLELARPYETLNPCRGGAAAKPELSRPQRLNAPNDQQARPLLAFRQEARQLLDRQRAGKVICGHKTVAGRRCPPRPVPP
jgi:hypothetical protein